MTDLARVAALIDACRRDGGQMPRASAALWLALWDARGRTLIPEQLEHAVEIILRREVQSYDGLRHIIKRARRGSEAAEWPVTINVVHGVGWWMDVSPGWAWEECEGNADAPAGTH